MLVAEVWAEDLQRYPADVIAEAERRHRTTSQYFPTVKNMIDHCEAVLDKRDEQAKRQQERLALPEGQERDLEAQCELNRKKLSGLLTMLRNQQGPSRRTA